MAPPCIFAGTASATPGVEVNCFRPWGCRPLDGASGELYRPSRRQSWRSAMTEGRIVRSVLVSTAWVLGVAACKPEPPEDSDAGAAGNATGGATGTGGSAGSGGSTSTGSGPCDIYAAASPPTPCVAAYSTTRLLHSRYGGPLYQVRKGSPDAGGPIQDIGVVAGGFADSAAQDAFCGVDACTISIIYDQSGQGNHLTRAPRQLLLERRA